MKVIRQPRNSTFRTCLTTYGLLLPALYLVTACTASIEGEAATPDGNASGPAVGTGGLGSTSGGTSAVGGSSPLLGTCAPGAVAPPQPSLLMGREDLIGALQQIFPAVTLTADELPTDTSTGAFVNSTQNRASEDYARQIASTAQRFGAEGSGQLVGSLVSCDKSQAACGAELTSRLLGVAFRRPPTTTEGERFGAFFAAQQAKYGFEEAASLLVEAALQSPQFLYRFEPTTAPPDARGHAPGQHGKDRHPFIIAGGLGGHFKRGQLLTFNGASHSDMLGSFVDAFGIDAAGFGNPAFRNGTLDALRV